MNTSDALLSFFRQCLQQGNYTKLIWLESHEMAGGLPSLIGDFVTNEVDGARQLLSSYPKSELCRVVYFPHQRLLTLVQFPDPAQYELDDGSSWRGLAERVQSNHGIDGMRAGHLLAKQVADGTCRSAEDYLRAVSAHKDNPATRAALRLARQPVRMVEGVSGATSIGGLQDIPPDRFLLEARENLVAAVTVDKVIDSTNANLSMKLKVREVKSMPKDAIWGKRLDRRELKADCPKQLRPAVGRLFYLVGALGWKVTVDFAVSIDALSGNDVLSVASIHWRKLVQDVSQDPEQFAALEAFSRKFSLSAAEPSELLM